MSGKNNLRFIKLLLPVMIAMIAIIIGATPSDAATNYTLTNRSSAKCMDLKNWITSNGQPIIQWSCNAGNNQRWQISKVSIFSSYYKIVNVHSGKCLDVKDGNTSAGTKIQQWSCSSSNINQQWALQDVDPGATVRYVIKPRGNTSVCLGVADISNGTQVQLQACTSAYSQQWLRQIP